MNSRKQALIFGAEKSKFSSNTQNNSHRPKDSSGSKISLTQAIEDFKLMAKVEGRSDKTLSLYDYVFERLSEQLSEGIVVQEIEPKDIRDTWHF